MQIGSKTGMARERLFPKAARWRFGMEKRIAGRARLRALQLFR
jgi:hypothetical protein